MEQRTCAARRMHATPEDTEEHTPGTISQITQTIG